MRLHLQTGRLGRLLIALVITATFLPASRPSVASSSGQPQAYQLTDITIGLEHICGLTQAGGVVCWGDNSQGQLGDGTFADSAAPVSVSGLSGVVEVEAGTNHTCARTDAGAVWCWGQNRNGALGDGTENNSPVPVPVSGLSSGVIALAVGGGYLPWPYYGGTAQHSCAVMAGGSVRCWGSNHKGQLGDGTTEPRFTPVDVVGLTEPAADVTAGAFHTCVKTTSGAAWCWGYNLNGQLGRGTMGEDSLPPAQVTGLGAGVAKIAAAGNMIVNGPAIGHTCALMTSGDVKCWGASYYGQIGDGSQWAPRLTPVDVVGLPGAATDISLGAAFSCAVAAGHAYCWGSDAAGQLGDGPWLDKYIPKVRVTPVLVARLGASFTRLATGGDRACAIKADRLWCWGAPGEALVGSYGSGFALGVAGLPEPVSSVAASQFGDHNCALGHIGDIYCWGDNYAGQIGNGTISENMPHPTRVLSLTTPATSVAAGGRHTCARVNTGEVLCWGNTATAHLPHFEPVERRYPRVVPGLPDDIVSLTAAWDRTCGLTTGGAAICWSEVLTGTSDPVWTTPEVITGWDDQVDILATADGHSCAILEGGGVQCVGNNDAGQLGDGTMVSTTTPVDVVGLSGPATALAAGPRHSCAVVGGTVQCWGGNEWGQLGDGTLVSSTTAVTVTGLGANATALTIGVDFTCALTDSGGVKCWGYNGSGSLGDPTAGISSTLPVDVLGLTAGVTQISAGWSHACARQSNGGLKCWGDNSADQLGQGFYADHASPRLVPVGPYLRLDGQTFEIGEPLFVTGLGFEESQSFDLILNSQVLSPAVQAVPGGGFVVNLDTSGADPGHYVLQTSANPLDAVGFDLLPAAASSASTPVSTPDITVPPGLAIFTYRLYLPFASLP